ncbi:MAG: amidohydrolase [Arenicellaceae bacterium]|nr:amidohydrolase [Arenicellaceae bacterium]
MIVSRQIFRQTVLILAGVLFAPVSMAQSAPDTVFINGKVLTVDAEFSQAEAVAVTSNQISAVGTNAEINALVGEGTRVIDLAGKTLMPGLIDNHNHLIYNSPTWPNGVRLGRVRTRAEALQRIAAKAKELGPGNDASHIVFALGGWNPVQFTDDQSEFTRAELDEIAPNNPVYTQISWGTAVLNSMAMELGGISNDMPEPEASTGGKIWRDADGNVTGKFTGAIFLKWQLRPLFPEVTGESAAAGLLAEIADYSKLGVTTSMTYNGPEFPEDGLAYIQEYLADAGKLDMRIYYPPHFGRNVSAWTPEEVPTVVAGLAKHKPYSGSEMYQMLHFGEHMYLPVSDSYRMGDKPYPDEMMDQFRIVVTAAAKNGWQVAEHLNRDITANQMLEIYEEVNQTYPITDLRWRFEHAQGLSQVTIERAKALGMAMGLHSSAAMSSPKSRASNATFSELLSKQDAPPLRWYQDSGIPFGLGSDAQVVAHDSPFFTLYWVVSGKDTSGQPYFKHGTLTREEALIAHTKSNAYLMHKEDILGSLEVGKLADIVVLDRDYMTVPVDDIRDLNSVLTMVDGRIVYEAM